MSKHPSVVAIATLTDLEDLQKEGNYSHDELRSVLTQLYTKDIAMEAVSTVRIRTRVYEGRGV